jgi:heme oxygenase
MGARDRLRQGTADAHAELEQLLQLTSSELTLGGYVGLLRAFVPLYTALEGAIDAHRIALLQLGYNLEQRSKLPLLMRDLAALGQSPWAAPPVPASQLPSLHTTAQVIGCLYVLEGATLGGLIIGRHLERHMQLGPANGAAFFCGYGPATGSNWKAFCAILERVLDNAQTCDDAVETARVTFQLFNERFGASHA